MLKYIGKRLLLFIPTLLIISFVIFFIIQLPPGDYVTSYVAAMAAEGEVFTAENLTTKRPGDGISPMRWYEVLGRTAKRDFAEDEQIEL